MVQLEVCPCVPDQPWKVVMNPCQAVVEKIGSAWTLRVLGFITLATGWPAAWFIRDRVPPNRRTFIDWQLFKDSRFVVLFAAGAVATFPLLV